jgi:hypothetical protein
MLSQLGNGLRWCVSFCFVSRTHRLLQQPQRVLVTRDQRHGGAQPFARDARVTKLQ